jgi:hypothetical protein
MRNQVYIPLKFNEAGQRVITGKIDIWIVGEGNFTKHSQGEAPYQKFKQYAEAIKNQLRKQKKEYMVTILETHEGHQKMITQYRSKMFNER